ncbi:hypothetical protein [Clostridium sporogenes]|uniref:hypothetical protein n=1 Tax=Clostridium sporogenes TaxID=1509 RepID=UPI0013D44ACF|nr:hypothetical protein [Clostridium sporogenes]NFH40782.1 hypothetical protein [Clostridium sporogenes]
MNKIDILIKEMKDLYHELNLTKVEDIDMNSLKKLKDFSQGYALDIQELIYGFEEMKERKQ